MASEDDARAIGSTTRPSVVSGVLLALVLLTAGCGDDGGSEPTPCPTGTHDADGLQPGCMEWTDCAPGSRVVSGGSAESDRECAPCGEGTFSASINALDCTAHRACGPGTRRVADGSTTEDTDCDSCETGTFSDREDATSCSAWTDCVPGELVEEDGFVTADRVCVACPPETFSETTNADECTPWMECPPWMEMATPATATGDRICTPWMRQFGTEMDDRVVDLVVDASGGVVMVGTTLGALPGRTQLGLKDGFVRALDAVGEVRWTTQLGTAQIDDLHSLATDDSGNVVVGGTTSGAFPGQSNGGGADAFVAKLDPDGTLLWVRQLGVSGNETAAVAVEPSGNVVLAGTTYAALPTEAHGGGADAFVRMYDADGAELWTVQIGSAADEVLHDVEVGPAGTIYAVGAAASGGASDGFVWKLDSEGSELWSQTLDSGDDDGLYRIRVAMDGSAVAAGYTTGTFPEETAGGATDVVVWSVGDDGETKWVRQLGSPWDEWAANVVLASDGDVVVVGSTPGTLPGQTSAGGSDGFGHRFDGDGVDVWTNQFGTPALDGVDAVGVAAGYLLIAGRTRGMLPGQTLLGAGDAFIARLDP